MPALVLPSGQIVSVHDGFIIGADAHCDLTLPGPGVALRHLIVQEAGGAWQAAVLTLHQQTWLNAAPLSGLARLREGDVLRVGESDLRWLATAPVAPPPPPASSPRRSGWLISALALVAILVLFALVVWQQRAGHPVAAPPATILASSTTLPLLATATTTPPPTATPSPEPSPSPTASATPTNTPTLTPVASATPSCTPPAGWRSITVRRGETLQKLGQRYGVRPARLRAANCLPSNRIRPGQQLYVPP